jgi:hypothetical protein
LNKYRIKSGIRQRRAEMKKRRHTIGETKERPIWTCSSNVRNPIGMESTGWWRRGRQQRIWCEDEKLMKERETCLRNKLNLARGTIRRKNLHEDKTVNSRATQTATRKKR